MRRRAVAFLAVFALTVLVSSLAQAQRPAAPVAPATPTAPAAADAIIRIRDLAGLGARAKVTTPRYTVNVSGSGRGEAKQWIQLATEYDTAPAWIDQITFQYYVLLAREVKGSAREYTLLRGSETYMDVAAGRRHLSTMYLRPTAVPRYGEPVAVAVEVTYQGNVIARQDVKEMELPDQWWTRPQLSIKEGYVLRRQETPFWFANYDDYEETAR
jgi:hypothetical protein